MTVVITAFERSPDGGLGLARDTRVRWGIEEVGQPYEVRLVSLQAKTEPVTAKILEGDRPWAEARLPLVKDRIRDRLVQLSARLGDADWLDGPSGIQTGVRRPVGDQRRRSARRLTNVRVGGLFGEQVVQPVVGGVPEDGRGHPFAVPLGAIGLREQAKLLRAGQVLIEHHALAG